MKLLAKSLRDRYAFTTVEVSDETERTIAATFATSGKLLKIMDDNRLRMRYRVRTENVTLLRQMAAMLG